MEDNVPDGISYAETSTILDIILTTRTYHSQSPNSMANVVSNTTVDTFAIVHMDMWAETSTNWMKESTALKAQQHVYILTRSLIRSADFAQLTTVEEINSNAMKPVNLAKHARVDVSKLPVTWKYNKSAWTTAEIFVEWLKVVNAAMRRQHGKILLLLLDNAPSHLNVELSKNFCQRSPRPMLATDGPWCLTTVQV
ncbi:hypothetical protein T07_4670 [Trichinella nelsoni]|uniref:DDE-1 domain-containing protein n=1 Tax=Trichinella nelsoni TaxID=6336 RepID=A0A0V0RLE1_9BILA|nr:hypothetical protein T07_4670 [Trichinella nelsoni]